MTAPKSHRPICPRAAAFTQVELAVVIVVLVVLALLLVPAILRYRMPAAKTNCVNNLKNIGLAYRIFATDNEGAWPWGLSVTNGGTQELLTTPWSPLPHLLVLSNELSTPKILVCPTDAARKPASSFRGMTASNLSYFLGLEATEELPASILGGDRNLTLNGVELGSGLSVLTTNGAVGFGPGIHGGAGNLLMGDGSVQQGYSAAVDAWFKRAFLAGETNKLRLLIP